MSVLQFEKLLSLFVLVGRHLQGMWRFRRDLLCYVQRYDGPRRRTVVQTQSGQSGEQVTFLKLFLQLQKVLIQTLKNQS
jgi:hypothetical protein